MSNLIVICGSRDFVYDKVKFESIIATFVYPQVLVMTGNARGPDRWAVDYCKRRLIHWCIVDPYWKDPEDGSFNSHAGLERNRIMALTMPRQVVAFWDGISRGTYNMIMHSKELKLETHVYDKNYVRI